MNGHDPHQTANIPSRRNGRLASRRRSALFAIVIRWAGSNIMRQSRQVERFLGRAEIRPVLRHNRQQSTRSPKIARHFSILTSDVQKTVWC